MANRNALVKGDDWNASHVSTELFDIAYCNRKHSAQSLPLCAYRYSAIQMCFD